MRSGTLRTEEAKIMTIEELNNLIARGAAQPGVRDALELMRLGQELDRQAREFLELYGAVSIHTVAASSGIVGPVKPTPANHAHLG
jgi:hypothetical protein